MVQIHVAYVTNTRKACKQNKSWLMDKDIRLRATNELTQLDNHVSGIIYIVPTLPWSAFAAQ